MLTEALVSEYRSKRMPRSPVHTFYLAQRPWQIQPCLIAPVLPNETMTRMLMQSRVVSDPLKNPLIGWHVEYHYFYVKLRDLDDRDDFTNMMLDVNADLSSHKASAYAAKYYTPKAGVNWVQYCMDRIVAEYYRDEDEIAGTFEIENVPVCEIRKKTFLQSAVNAAEFTTGDLDIDVDLNADATITTSEVERANLLWQHLRHAGVTEMSFEDYLRSYGVKTPETIEPHRPELLRTIEEWTYPTNTVNPSDGAPSSAISLAVSGSADKKRYFPEPGFIFGVSVIRPKVYFGNQKGNGAALLDNALSWLPAMFDKDASVSWKAVANADGPLENVTDTDGYSIDMRDLFVHGDQFINLDLTTATGIATISLPAADLKRRFASASDALSLFVDDDPGDAAYIRQDGVQSLTILGRQSDRTP
jgi:hypothetical protein